MTKILMAVPLATSYIRTDCVQSFYNMRIPENIELKIEFINGYSAARARNLACCIAIDEGFDEILFVDSDQIIPPDTLEKLLVMNTSIQAGWSMMNVADQRTNISVYDPTRMFYDFILHKDLPEGIIEVDAIGFAAILIKTDILKKIQYPYFRYVEYPNRTTLSEDLYFCDMARRNGIRIFCDTSLRILHSKTINI